MREVDEIIAQLGRDFPQLVFRAGRKFAFRPPRTVVYEEFEQKSGDGDNSSVRGAENCYKLCLMHEVGHALAGHRTFRTDPERLKMEREAWERARGLCGRYGVEYDEEFVEGRLDSYRDWLHRRSRCPGCGLTRFQRKDGRYYCPNCLK